METHFLLVQTLMNWANEGVNLWELMTITNTDDWKLYIDNALQRGWPAAMVVWCYPNGQGAVGGHEEDEAEEEVLEDVHEEVRHVVQDIDVAAGQDTEAQAQGVADEGEVLQSIVQQMHNEDMEAAQMEEHEYSSDEDYPIPSQWSNPGFGNPMVADSREQECEYRGNEVVQEAKYSSSGDVKDAVKRWAVSLSKEFKVARSNSSVYDVVCVKEGCPWRVHAYKGTFKSY